MRTAMIAALPCALLCSLLSASPAHALQCESGQASLTLTKQGQAPNGTRAYYTAVVRGMSALDFADIPDVKNVSSLNLYFVSGSNPAVALPYKRKFSDPSTCLYFADGSVEVNDDVSVKVLAGHAARTPHICYRAARDMGFALDIEVHSNQGAAEKLKLTDARIYAQGKREDGTSFTLFDTSTPCKE
jgi:hypothetical protein